MLQLLTGKDALKNMGAIMNLTDGTLALEAMQIRPSKIPS